MFAATALAGLFLGLLIGAPTGFAYAVARRGWADRDRAKELVQRYEKEARSASLSTVGWLGIGVVVLVVAVACMVGTGRRDAADPGACPPASGSVAGPVSRASPGPAVSGAAAVSGGAAAGHRGAVSAAPTARQVGRPCP